MKIKIERWGNSAVIRLHKTLLNQLSIKEGEVLEVEGKNNSIVFKPFTLGLSLEEILVTSPAGSFEQAPKIKNDWNYLQLGVRFSQPFWTSMPNAKVI